MEYYGIRAKKLNPADYGGVADYPVIILDPQKTLKIKAKRERLY